ncbi:Rossmann alpha beta alpha sandwich fold [Echinococcus multilocularis]|uniref:ethanolamine-phosphate cytidylyltransferase n=1 Tax=Echinococcus multilocularis TaxID=6211 RepID=A0A087VZN5_ECHMU|nr:Rossmann alpha beta alpha sandwich fold [Echinococcus multilocularis]
MQSRKPTRVWVDGCFDMVHFGHANLVRQAKCLGDYLIAGIHSDGKLTISLRISEEITRHKGPPVFTQEERYILLKAIKWVDEVVKDAPYMTQLEVLQGHNCDFCVHGNDISVTEDGSDAYEIVKKAGKYAEVSRTEGISTTDLLYRILRATGHFKARNSNVENGSGDSETSPISTYTSGITHYMPNALRIAQFMSPGSGTAVGDSSSLEGIRAHRAGERVVYAPGAFDLMHVGHVKFLEKCRQLGTYLIVGLHSDKTAALESGRIGPILNMDERFLSLLACRYVNNVILDAPLVVTDQLLDFFKVDVVAVGMHSEDDSTSADDPMAIPRRRGIFRKIDSSSDVTTRQVIHRIIANQAYVNRNRSKEAREAEAIARSSNNSSLY